MTRSLAVKKVSKGMYPATYNFKDEADGTSGTSITGVDYTAGNVQIIAVEDGHRKVIEIHDDDNTNHACRIAFTASGLTDSVEYFIKTSDATKESYLQLRDATNNLCVDFGIDADNFYYDAGGGHVNIVAAADDVWYHNRIAFDLTANTFHVHIAGIQYGPYGFNTADDGNGITRFLFYTQAADQDYYIYIDAVGLSWDTDYKIGDNIHYRHFKESTDSFEDDDVGTQGTSITWVDAVDTAASVEIVPEFDEHKKVLRQDYTSAAGGYDRSTHTFASQTKDSWISFWIKVTDVTGDNQIMFYEGATLITSFRINSSQFQKYTGGAWSQIAGSGTPANDTWYFIYLEIIDAATDTITCLIANIEYETYNAQANQTSGIDSMLILSYASGDYVYIDAPMSSLDSDERADNRTFDYHDPYTKTDITSDVIDVVNYENKIYGWRKATLISKEEYKFTNEFFQIYDVNSVLAIEGEIKNRIQDGVLRRYPLRDKNYDDLMDRITNTFATDAIHDPTDSTSLLKVALPNVDQTEGDLLLADADTEAATYSPTLKNHPTHMFLRDISDLGDTVTIIKANGVVLLDDDLASGDTLDIDTAAHKAKFTKAPPTVIDILEVINYFEIFGAINPDTGERFYKIIDNSGDDKKRKWRYVNNEFNTQTDVDAYAAILATRVTTVKIITFTIQDLGVHNMGTTLNFKFVQGDYNIPQANYYIISETITSMNSNTATIILSEGLIEESKYSATFERPEAYVNSYASEIYETDKVVLDMNIRAYFGATWNTAGYVDANDTQGVVFYFYLPTEVDASRDMILYWVIENETTPAGNKNIDIDVFNNPADDTNDTWTQKVVDQIDADDYGDDAIYTHTQTIASTYITAGYVYKITAHVDGAWDNNIYCVTLKYFVKRT